MEIPRQHTRNQAALEKLLSTASSSFEFALIHSNEVTHFAPARLFAFAHFAKKARKVLNLHRTRLF